MTSSEKRFSDYTIKQAPVVDLQIPLDAAGNRLDVTLAALLPEYSRSRIQEWIRQGDAMLDGKQASPSQRVHGGESIVVHLQAHPAELPSIPQAIGLDVVFEDDELLVLNKPAGLVVHPGSGNWEGTLLNGLLHYLPMLAEVPRAGIVHRLDKDTSGLMVVAKTVIAQTALVRQLQARTVKREYWAIVHGDVLKDGVVDAPMGRHATQRTRMAVLREGGHGKEAVTRYFVEENLSGYTWLRCQLETGRTHQIRVHMQYIGFPLVGDPVYQGRRRRVSDCDASFTRQALHAFRLGLLHPVSGEPLFWQRDPPDDFSRLLNCLREQAQGVTDD